MSELVTVAVAGAAAVSLLGGGAMYAGNWPASQVFGRTLVAPRDRDEVWLTYDDGPSPEWTPLLLDVLGEANVRATFFMMGAHVRQHAALARRVAEAGHLIGNHTFSHPKLLWRGAAETRRELEQCQRQIEDAAGISPQVFRPPFGARNPVTLRVAREMGLTPVMWNVTVKDWEPLGVEAMTGRIERKMRFNQRRGAGSCLLLHDASHVGTASRADTVEVTRRMLRGGWRFGVPGLL